MSQNLAALSTEVLNRLMDPTGAKFDDPTLETAIRQALNDFNQKCPRWLEEEIDAVAGQLTYDLSTVSGLVSVCAVVFNDDYYPFSSFVLDAAPYIRLFEVINTGSFKIVYKAYHTIEDLDSATAGTLTGEQENTLLDLAAGYACVIRAGGRIEANNLVKNVPEQTLSLYRTWLSAYQSGIAHLQRRNIPDIGKPNTNHWADQWEGW